ncbi:MAG: tryptophan-rich sensory protein [Clostridium sp.]|jgi:tryptophan-rich sensory protein
MVIHLSPFILYVSIYLILYWLIAISQHLIFPINKNDFKKSCKLYIIELSDTFFYKGECTNE